MKGNPIHPTPNPIPGPTSPLEGPLEMEWRADFVLPLFDHSPEIQITPGNQISEPEEIGLQLQFVKKPLEIKLNPIK